MKIVIEIDENLYTRLFDNGVDNYDDALDMAKAIRKGTSLSTEEVVSIKQIINEIDELYYDFENSDGNLTTFIIEGETLHTDVGYAIEGIEFYKNILKKRISKYCGSKMKGEQE